MQQTNLELDDDPAPSPVLTPQQQQALITAMADAILCSSGQESSLER